MRGQADDRKCVRRMPRRDTYRRRSHAIILVAFHDGFRAEVLLTAA